MSGATGESAAGPVARNTFLLVDPAGSGTGPVLYGKPLLLRANPVVRVRRLPPYLLSASLRELSWQWMCGARMNC